VEGPYEIVFNAQRGNASSFLAIDDVFFKNSEFCSINPPQALTSDQLPLPSQMQTTTPVSTVAPSIYDCDFEKNNFCNWKNDLKRPLNWTLETGKSLSDCEISLYLTKIDISSKLKLFFLVN
jgi:hypothetical protein